MTAPLARSLPVLALYMAALRLGILAPRKRRQWTEPRQLTLETETRQPGEALPLEGGR